MKHVQRQQFSFTTIRFVSVSENYEHKLINFKNLADLSQLPGVYFKMNREARISLRAFFLQPMIPNYVVFFATFTLYLWSENVKTF